MVSRKYYYILIIRICLLAVNSLALFLVVFHYPNYSIIIILILTFVFQVVMLIHYLLRINKKLENFFLIYLSGEIVSSNARMAKSDEFAPLYSYFDRIMAKLEESRLENEIRNNYFKTIVDETSVGLISFNPDGSVELFNEAAKRIFGMQVLRNLKKLNRIKEGLHELLLNMGSNERKLISFILDGELIQLASKKVIFKTGEKILHLVSFQNIKPELEEKEIEAWQRLIRVLTHEIMNSMTPILTLVGTIMKKLTSGQRSNLLKKPDEITASDLEKTVKGLELINSRGQGLIHFVQNYRSVTQLPKPVFQIINVKDLLSRIKSLFDESMKLSGIFCTIKCNPSLYIQADGKLLEQVLINLFKNSIEALTDIPGAAISLTAQSSQEQTLIEVSDNGKGIPEYLLEDVFIPFFTTRQEGSGIGLSLSRQIVRLHGGSLTVQSEPFVKTAFIIKI